MKKFYQNATTGELDGQAVILLDGRPVKTPARHNLSPPTDALAAAIAEEWNQQGEEIMPESMPLTQLASTAIDRIAAQREAVTEQIARYAQTDLTCYHTDTPAALAARQRAAWEPLLAWVEAACGAKLATTSGLQPVPQDEAALAGIADAIAALDNFRLATLSSVTAAAGSVVIGLALVRGQIDGATAVEAAQIDEIFQLEQWGADAEEEARLARLSANILAAERFLALLD